MYMWQSGSPWIVTCNLQAQKAKEKEEDHELKEKLDADFTALAQSNGLLSLVRPKKVDALKSLLAKGPVLEGSSITKVLQGGDKTLEEKVLDTFLPHYFFFWKPVWHNLANHVDGQYLQMHGRQTRTF